MTYRGFIGALVLIIACVVIGDYGWRVFRVPQENIVSTGDFVSSGVKTVTNATEEDENSDDALLENETEEAAEEEGVIILELTASDMASGCLIDVDESHVYSGTTAFTDFSGVTDANVKPRLATLSIRADILSPLQTMFDAYASYNGWANLQIYSTLQSTLSEDSIYTNNLPDRSTGLSFDIGLITSTGEVVPYIQKHNEWMVENSWQYGFILRYPSDKTEITGITYAPHHFRYVGQPHAAIMHEHNFCLEEYLGFLQGYTQETGGLVYEYGGETYSIFYVPASSMGTTYVTLDADGVYDVSGDNRNGFVITQCLDTAAATIEENQGETIPDIPETENVETVGET